MVDFSFNKQVNQLICCPKGRMSADVTSEIAISIGDKINATKNISADPDGLKIIFDLKEVDYIASSFIRICVSTAKQLKKGNFEIINSDPVIKKTYKVAGLDEILNVN